MAKAVVASPQAFTGIAARAGEHLLAANTAAEWIAEIERLWSDADLCARLGAAARRFVQTNPCWESCLRPFADLLGLPSRANEASGKQEAVAAAMPRGY